MMFTLQASISESSATIDCNSSNLLSKFLSFFCTTQGSLYPTRSRKAHFPFVVLSKIRRISFNNSNQFFFFFFFFYFPNYHKILLQMCVYSLTDKEVFPPFMSPPV
ncbi:hypothetical protein AA313_de0202127 [Arthrobotrys entomopaga]|nr:hypothetical protein AA313_de0202127 [Arthrobotrys entomopaga]